MAQPMLGEVELQQVQALEADEHLASAQHGVPALEGDFLQRDGRRLVRLGLEGVVAGPEAREGLARLQEQFRAVRPLPFVADIATATRVGEVLIETLDVRELAGRPQRFAYAVTVREFIPPPVPETVPPEILPPRLQSLDTGTLIVEVRVEGQPDFDFAAITLMVERTDGPGPFSRTPTAREANVWTEEGLPPGQYRASAVATAPTGLSGSAAGALRAGQTTRLAITLTPGAVIATTFVVHFRFDKAFVEPCMRVVLRQVRQHARTHPDEKLLIVGHTDKTGSDAYNQSLSERRARAVFAFLTVGRDAAASSAALAEWNQIRLNRPPGELPTIKDNWGLREAQHMLQDLNFYPGNVDGRDGPLTQEGIRAFRCQHGLPPGTTMDDATWEKLIQAYLAQDSLSIPAIPEGQFLRNAKDDCDGGMLKWVGCGEQDPVRNVPTAERRNRRTELLFVRASALPCAVPQPDTFNLPTPGAVGSSWCLGPGDPSARCCFVFSAAPSPNAQPRPDQFVRTPAQPDTITVTGSLTREKRQPDGTVEFVPVPNQRFVLITPDGEFLAGEQSNGDPQPARTDADGRFEFRDKPSGVYAIEVLAPVLVRRELQADEDVRGNATCRVLQPGVDQFNVVIIDAPAMREIRLPTAVRLITALHPATRAIRQCIDARGRTNPQATAHSDGDARDFFDGEDGPDAEGANKIWRQARVRFQLDDADIVSEAYAFRTDCEIDSSEFAILLERCAYHNAINVFLVGDLAGDGGDIGGLFLRIVTPAPRDTAHGCTVSDRRDFIGIRSPLTRQQTVQALAHEIGHYLNLEHVTDPDRLMFDGLLSGANRRLIGAEVDRARASDPAALECLPLELRVAGASRVGGPLSDHFLALQDPAGTVTVDAEISPALIDPTVGALSLVGGTPGAGPLQASVPRAATGLTEIFAIYTPVGAGRVVKARAAIRVATFDLGFERPLGAGLTESPPGTVAGEPFAGERVTILATLTPSPFCVPRTLVTWAGGDEAPDPLHRTVSRAAPMDVMVSGTAVGTTRSVRVVVFTLSLSVTGAAQFGGPASNQFGVSRRAGGAVTIRAIVAPPSALSLGLIWTGDGKGAQPDRRVVPTDAMGVFTVRARLSGVTKTVLIHVLGEVLSFAQTAPASAVFDELSDPNVPVMRLCDTTPGQLQVDVDPGTQGVFYTADPPGVVTLTPAQRTGDGPVTIQPLPLPAGTDLTRGRETFLSVRAISATGPELSRRGQPARVRIRQFQEITAFLFVHVVRDDAGDLRGTTMSNIITNLNETLDETNRRWGQACIRFRLRQRAGTAPKTRNYTEADLQLDFIDETDLLDITVQRNPTPPRVTFPTNENDALFQQGLPAGRNRNTDNPTFINVYLIDQFLNGGSLGGFAGDNFLIIERGSVGGNSLLAHEAGHCLGLRDLENVAGVTDIEKRLMRSATPRGDLVASDGVAGDETLTARGRAARFTG